MSMLTGRSLLSLLTLDPSFRLGLFRRVVLAFERDPRDEQDGEDEADGHAGGHEVKCTVDSAGCRCKRAGDRAGEQG